MRFLYACIAIMLWCYLLGNCGVAEMVSNDTLLLALSIVAAGGLAGGA